VKASALLRRWPPYDTEINKVKQSNESQTLSPERYEEAEERFLRAIEIAQRQRTKSLELRAAMSLARLWQQQGKTKGAHELLSEVYSWFTEGFDTKDLQEAKALLEDLGKMAKWGNGEMDKG
jgi:predicted ATPase